MAVTIEEICHKAQGLPASPTVLPKLLELLGREDSNLEDLEKIIQTDTGLSAAVLRMANSVFFGGSGRYTEIAQAILHLGFSSTHELVMTVAGGRWNSVDLEGYSWQPGDFFRHNFAVAVAASTVAKEVKYDSPETTYVAGLMHEAGKLALAYASPQSIVEIRAYQKDKNCDWLDAEKAVLGFGHNEISRMLMEKWNFPEPLVDAALNYPTPEAAADGNRKLVQIVHIAKHVAIQTGIGVAEDAFWLEPHEDVLGALGLEPDDLEPILGAVLEKIQSVLKENTLAGEIKI